MTCKNKILQSVIHALNTANAERYNEVKVQYPGFIWDPPLIDINKLVMLVQRVYPAQVVEYALGRGKKSSPETENTDKHKVEETAGWFPPTKHKANNNSLALKWIKTMLFTAILLSIVIQVFFNKLDQVQES